MKQFLKIQFQNVQTGVAFTEIRTCSKNKFPLGNRDSAVPSRSTHFEITRLLGRNRVQNAFLISSAFYWLSPLLVPIYLAIAVAVRLTSSGPVLFLQKRVGRNGELFTILKFRTLVHSEDAAHHAVTTTENQRFTPVGPFLRRLKLDELPQLLNVLVGDMSLVGARPKLPEHQVSDLQYRPGITGAATYAFAREEKVLSRIPKHYLDTYYHTVILPAKRRLDEEYMAHATFRTDLKLIVNSVLRRWDDSVMDQLPYVNEIEEFHGRNHANVPSTRVLILHPPNITYEQSLPSAEQ